MEFYHDSVLGVVICLICQAGIAPEGKAPFQRHLRSPPHGFKGDKLKATCQYLQSLKLKAPADISYPSTREQPVQAIPHLKVLTGFRCLHCDDWLSVNEPNTRDHVSKVHHIRTGRRRQGYESCLLQTIFRARSLTRYIRVLEPTENAAPRLDTRHDTFLRQQLQIQDAIHQEERKQADVVAGFDAHRSTALPWVQSCGFARYLRHHSKAELHRLCEAPSAKEEPDAPIRQVLDMVESLLNETWGWCLDGPSCRLTRPMAVMLSQFWNVATVHSRGFRPGISLHAKATYFNHWKRVVLLMWHTLVLDEWPKIHVPANEQEPNANEGPKPDLDFFHATPQQVTALHACLQAARDQQEHTLRSQVFELSLALIQHVLPGYRYESPLLAYTAIEAVQPRSGEWKAPGDFNSCLSALVYCAQLWIFRLACDQVEAEPDARADTLLEQLCQQWLRQEKSTTFGVVLNWRLMLFHVSKHETMPKHASWSLDNEEVCYQGSTMSMSQVTQLYRHTLADARRILEEDLLLKSPYLAGLSAHQLSEGEHRREVGWWFVKDARNQELLRASERALLTHVAETRYLRKAFIEPGTEEKFRPEAIRVYNYADQQFLARIAVLIQLDNPPLRIPELFSITYRNTERPRNMYIKHGRLMIYTNYHKTQEQTGKMKDTVRFASRGLEHLLLRYLALVPPFRQQQAWQIQKGTILSSHLFTRDNQVWDDTVFTSMFRRSCARADVPQIPPSHWRQMSASIIKLKFSSERHAFDVEDEVSDDDEMGEDNAGEADVGATLARMSNHSVRTHNRAYANATGLAIANVWDGLIKRAHRASLLWSTFFRFDEDSPDSGRKRRRSQGDDGRGILKQIAITLPTPRRHWTSEALLVEARRLLRDPSLQWRCREQEQAICAVMSGASEVLAVLATGTGKSLLFQLPSSLPGARTTVLIVPLVALHVDLLKQCREMGIDCDVWQQGSHSHAALVFVSVEVAVQGHFFQYLYDLHQARHLDRIIFEEAHLILNAASYRRAMTQLVRLRAIPVPFVYSTATLPPYLRDQLVEQHHLSGVTEIRGRSRRGNLRYRVHRLSHGRHQDLFNEAAQCIRRRWTKRYESLGSQHRCLVFTRGKHDAERLAGLLRCEHYHSDLGEGDIQVKEEVLRHWMQGESGPFLVGTSGLGTGLNYKHVRLVVHIDEPYSLVAFAQESGRAGRDGERAESMIILARGWRPDGKVQDPDIRAIQEVLTTSDCVRVVMGQFLDGNETVQEVCQRDEEVCDRCSSRRGSELATGQHREAGKGGEDEPRQQEQQLLAGAVVRRRRLMEAAGIVDRYVERLEGLIKQCVMCRIRGREWRHSLDSCGSQDRHVYFDAKKEVLRVTRRRWIAPKAACYRCFQPQWMCQDANAGGRGETCRYKDVVMAGMVALWLEAAHQEWLWQEWQVRFSSGWECLRWAGETTQLGEEICVRGVVVMAAALGRLG